MQPSGRSSPKLRWLVSVAVLSATACMPYGFSGGGLPTSIRTIAVIPFSNQTATADLQRELSDSLRSRLQRRLGLRDAPEARANAVVRGTIQRYEVDIPVGFTDVTRGPNTTRRMVQMVVDIEVMNQVNGKVLWARKGVIADGQYEERGEARGRALAIARIVNDVIDGLQSQW